MDLFKENQQEIEQATRAVPPVIPAEEAKSTRRRRTERFSGLIDEADMLPAEDSAPEASPAQATQLTPAVQEDSSGTRVNAPVTATRAQPRIPSQGVPRPAALSGQEPHRAQQERSGQTVQGTPIVRRPVSAEGYAPLQQLGASEQPRARRPEAEAPRRVRTPETERIAYENLPAEEDEKGASRGLIAIIIALLVLAALIIGLIMIPEEDTGVLGSVKRAVTEPVKRRFAGDDDTGNNTPATASSFTATISQATAPYKVVFHMVTSSDVTAVRVLDEQGNVIPTKTTLSAPNSETTIVWMFEMTLESGFTGHVQAQVQDGDAWIDTGLKQALSLGDTTPPTVSSVPVSAATPTAEPSAEPVSTPTDAPAETPAPATAVPEDTPEVTATPTMSVTATPPLVPTAPPTAEPPAAPTEEALAAAEDQAKALLADWESGEVTDFGALSTETISPELVEKADRNTMDMIAILEKSD